ncbi:MAG: segregation/condensation protein A [Candidatus Promineifilaceae bacterium]
MTTGSYRIELPAFTGPLDLLLHLIERNELDITAISLSTVTEQYLDQIEQLKQEKVEHLIDFLVIGARLVLIKSRALLPQMPSAYLDDEEEEDPAEALARQLREYKRFKLVAAWLAEREGMGLRTYLRLAPPPKLESHLDLSGITIDSLISAVQAALERNDQLEESVTVAVKKRSITIEGQMSKLRNWIKTHEQIFFHELLTGENGRVEVSITLLAVLELIKRYEVDAIQPILFGPIEIRRRPEEVSS